MAKINNINLTDTFVAVRDQTVEGDSNNCFPIALAIASGLPLSVWTEAMAKAGRQLGKGTKIPMAVEAAKALGFELKPVDIKERVDIRSKYKGVHAGLKGMTTHHPIRFSYAWEGFTGILITPKHAAAVVNGVNHDWSVNNQLRVTSIWRLFKDGEPVVPVYDTPECYLWKDPADFEAPTAEPEA